MSNLMSMFDEFDDLFGFGRPTVIRFNSAGTKDMTPAHFTKWKEKVVEDGKEVEKFKGYRCIARTVGIDASDVKVSCVNNGIVIQGETTYEGNRYSQYIELPISKDVMATIKSVNYTVKNGLTHVYLEVKPSEATQIPVRMV